MDRSLAHTRADCQALLEEVFGYLDGELSPARCRKIERHLEACPCCGYLAVRLRRAVAVCRVAGRSSLPPGVRREARARIAELLGSAALARGSTARTPKKGRRATSVRLER